MGILKQWRDRAYDEKANRGEIQRMWSAYFAKEKEIYADLLKNPDEVVKGTVKELAEKYGVDLMTMVGFLDGINESIKTPNDLEEMDENSEVEVEIIPEKLFFNMLKADADYLYGLEQWEDILGEEEMVRIAKEYKQSKTVRRATPKIGRNDPCPCGSGKKYKHCCGR